VGLILRGLATERAAKKKHAKPQAVAAASEAKPLTEASSSRAPLLCAVRGLGRTLDFAIAEAKDTARPLYILFVREQAIVTPEDRRRQWQEDAEAARIFEYAGSHATEISVVPCYAVSDSAADTIVDTAATVGASRLILGAPQRSAVLHLLRGNIIRQVSDLLPENIHLLVYA